MPALPRLRTTRRTALGGALAGLAAVAGCEEQRPDADPPPPAPTDPDTALVVAVTAELDELVALVALAAERRPLLAAGLAPFAALHEAHRGVLPDREAEPPRSRVVGSPREVAGQVLRREALARNRLGDWSVAAESGALARLLASMSAGVAAHLAATDLPAGPPR